MSEWIKAEEYCVSVFDGTHDTPKVTETGYKLVTSKNILSNTLDLNSAYFISEEDFVNINKRSKVKQYDILFSMIGTVGSLYFETSDTIDYAIKNIGVFSCGDKEKAEWLYYYLQSSYARQYIKRYLNGAVQKFLPLKGLREFPVPQFNKELHNRIKILLNIDQKIQINNQINQELEAMAKTLYDYWFVQFDFPDQNGKPYKSSGGKMVYHPELKREIPEGWGVEKLGDIETNIVTGKTPSRSIPENFGGDIPFITIGDIRGNTFIYSSAETLSDLGAEEQNKKYLPPNSLCVSCIATVGEIGFTTQLSQTNQQINSIIFNDVNHMYFLYFALKLFFESSKTKTGNTFANMSKDDFSKILIIYPDSSVIKNYYEKVKSMFDKIKCLQLQNQELTQLRDWLLPMLMNGQVKVEDKT